MTRTEHENYAQELLSSLSDDNPEIENLRFDFDRTQKGNAARAMTAILCHKLFKNSKHQPKRIGWNIYEWNEGVFMCRNISDRPYLWTNVRRNVAEVMHSHSENKSVAYLLAFSNPSDTTLNVWALPEPLLFDSLPSLPVKKSGQECTVQISTNKQRIEHFVASPDLAPFFRELPLSRQELLVLRESREVDALVKREHAKTPEDELTESDEDDVGPTAEFDTNSLLAVASLQLTESGAFDPSGISDARERVLSSIVRRRGQPAFRQHLLAAYNCQCAVTGCGLEPVLDAAHIIPYKGPETNHPTNGLLLRTDLHALFDLKLVAIDAKTMRLLVAPSLAGTCYEEYQGKPITVPNDPASRPSSEALEQHRKESGL